MVHKNKETGAHYRCFVQGCNKLCAYESSLKKHIQNLHPVEYESQIVTLKVHLCNLIEYTS